MEKKYQEGDYQAVHLNPVWGSRADYMILAYLGEENGKNEWEKLSAMHLKGNRFAICCIPFFTYDIALGDEVETDQDYVIEKVVAPSGQVTFRIWFGESEELDIKENVLAELTKIGLEIEWSSENLLAASANNQSAAQIAADYLFAEEKAGKLVYETGR